MASFISVDEEGENLVAIDHILFMKDISNDTEDSDAGENTWLILSGNVEIRSGLYLADIRQRITTEYFRSLARKNK